MDSKSNFPTSSCDNDPAPPPSYTESLASPQPPSSLIPYPSDRKSNSESPYSPSKTHYSSQIQSQLASITSTITSLQTQKDLLSHAQDQHILSLLTTEIQIYLSSFAKSGLHRGTLILVPKRGLKDRNALPAMYDFRDPEHFDRVVRVADGDEKDGGRDGEGEREEYYSLEEDEGERGETWYWHDEAMALRLAKYLKPARDPRTLELPPRKEELQAQAETASSGSKSRGFWGRKKEDRPPLIEEPGRSISMKVGDKKDEDRVIMDVIAEEVVFRTENDFGILETKRGWGIVLKLKVALGKR